MGLDDAAEAAPPWATWAAPLAGALLAVLGAAALPRLARGSPAPAAADGCAVELRASGGRPVELLWAGSPAVAAGAPGAPLAVVVPGFPGVARVYGEFLAALAEAARCRAVCVAWPGQHEVPGPPGHAASQAPPASLEECASFLTAVICELCSLPSVGRVVLVGHSLGCWFVARALEALDGSGIGSSVAAVCLLCPVMLDIETVPRALRLRRPLRIVHRLHAAKVVHLVSALVPASLGAAVLHGVWFLRGKAGRGARDRLLWRTVVAHLQLGVLERAVALAVEALGALGAPGAWLPGLRARGPAVLLHFAEGDGWTPPELRRRLQRPELLPRARQRSHRMPHGIVTHRGAAAAAAAAVGADLAAALERAAGAAGA